ncbi:hypothetical protein HC891_01120, partial [Candidatus Gracilibacteria bacterium]|nr:hypothetical protein [Candidatus Gracilibacteria bacterium]
LAPPCDAPKRYPAPHGDAPKRYPAPHGRERGSAQRGRCCHSAGRTPKERRYRRQHHPSDGGNRHINNACPYTSAGRTSAQVCAPNVGGSRATAALPRPGGYADDAEDEAPRRPWLLVGVTSALIVILVTIGIALFLPTLQSVRVAVTLPVPPEETAPFDNLPIAINAVGAPASDSAVSADTVGGEVRFASSGTITTSVLTPVGSANGIVTLRNSSAQALPFPAGTEFVALSDVGQEVRFVANEAFTVPEATTSDQGAQIITTRGQTQVPVVARAPGSASNVGANSIQQMIVPGQGPINVAGGNPQAIHDPLQGGTEEEVFLVKESDVQPVLADALTGLDTQARQEMSAAAAGRGLALEPTTVLPNAAMFAQLQGFEYTVTPAAGQTVDPANPTFTVETRARYSALAAPSSNGLALQLQQAVPGLLRQTGRLGQCQKAEITGWSWDGALLTVAGRVVPDTEDQRCNQEQLDEITAQQIRDAVRGKPRAEAIAALDVLVAEGVIASYELPEVEQLPERDGQISVGLRGLFGVQRAARGVSARCILSPRLADHRIRKARRDGGGDAPSAADGAPCVGPRSGRAADRCGAQRRLWIAR